MTHEHHHHEACSANLPSEHEHGLEHGHQHEHHDHHGLHHHHHAHAIEKLSTIYIVAVALNLLFVIVEAVAGFIGNSLGLLSDAGHNLSDVFSLLLAMIALKLASSHATKRFTYGHRKASVLISLLNAIILLVAVGAIIVESIDKFFNPGEVNGSLIIWTAAVGIVINGVTAWVLSRQNQHDINTRGAFLHMLADTLVSVGVVVSGVVINLTGWTIVDPIIGLVIAVVILVSTWSLLSESLRMSTDAVPEGFDADDIRNRISAQDLGHLDNGDGSHLPHRHSGGLDAGGGDRPRQGTARRHRHPPQYTGTRDKEFALQRCELLLNSLPPKKA